MMNSSPFFSIGITTYNRIDLLRLSILSVLAQEFRDFEIIVGNDYVTEDLTCENIGITDSRIKIVNNDKNLGEVGNMNMLLSKAAGKYFTWQFDDDLCAPSFLKEAYAALEKYNFPRCLYTSLAHIYGRSGSDFMINRESNAELYTGSRFLRSFLSGNKRIMGSAGLYDTDFLRGIGGAIKLSSGNMAVYSEYLMIFNACQRSEIAYVDSQLVAFRIHESSWSGTSAEVMLYREAGINLLRASLRIFCDPALKNDYQKNLESLLKSIIGMVFTKSRLAGIKMSMAEIDEYYDMIYHEFNDLTPDLKQISVTCLDSTKKYLPFLRLKAFLRKNIPMRYLRVAHLFADKLSPYINKSF